MKDPRFAKLVVLVNGLVPLALMAWDAWRGKLGANPVEYVLHMSGKLTLIFLTLSLAVTPIRKLTGANYLSHFRRMLGLFAFYYGFGHFMVYVAFTKLFNVREVIADTIERKFILLGMAAFFLMLPLAVTSTNSAIKRMGAARWKLLHRLVYVAAIAGVSHYWIGVKADTTLPMAFAVVLAILLLYRIVDALRPHSRKPAPAPRSSPKRAAI
jgi:sulfoxide reductase heme-binding subunit YedZ